MSKSLTNLWLKSLRRMGKVQQAQGRKVLKSLMPKPPRVPAVRRVKPVKVAKLVKPARVVTAAAKKALKPGALPAPGSTAAGLPGKWQKSYFSLPGTGPLATSRRMLYWLYLPSGVAQPARPLVVMLHGCQQSATDFAASTRMNRLAERKGFAVLYPQQSVSSDSHRCWHWYKRATQQGLGDVELIAQMIVQVQARHKIDASRTYVAGLSAGAGLAAILALRYPQMIAAVGLHSAPVYGTSDSPMSGFKAMQQGSTLAYRESARNFFEGQPQFPGIPVMLLHGKRDAVVRPINADQLAAQFVIVNAAFITSAVPVQRSYAARHGGRSPQHGYQTATYYAGRKPQLVKCEIDSLGHAWSGGDGQLSFSAPEGPDATLLMWSFFERQQRLPLSLPVPRAAAKVKA
ncbi:MAG: PHB depolymerase family esterase [Pseudomonadota bacterium]|nr:PHB depolymerase family esterase [Pseudomonadota bacterium]